MNKFKKSYNIKKFHKSYTIRLFLFFSLIFIFFLHYFDCINIISGIIHQMRYLRLHGGRRLHDVTTMMLVDERIIANDRVFEKLDNVIGQHQNFRNSLPKDL